MVLAYHGIDLPIANAGFFGNDDWALVNTHAVSDLSTLVLGAVRLLTFLVALSKVLIQRTTMALVGPDVLIDSLMAYQDAQIVF